jgi:hypothetical protein
METYTLGTTPINVILSRLPHKYDMSLNKSDMTIILESLAESDDQDAWSLRSSILETIGIEEI